MKRKQNQLQQHDIKRATPQSYPLADIVAVVVNEEI